MGLDDVRPFNYRQKGQIPIFAAPETMAAIQRCFQYIFDGGRKESNVPKLEARVIDGAPFDLFGMEFQPVPDSARQPDDLRLSLRRRGLPDGP